MAVRPSSASTPGAIRPGKGDGFGAVGRARPGEKGQAQRRAHPGLGGLHQHEAAALRLGI